MRPRMRTMALAGGVAIGGVLLAGARDANAQLYIGGPGFSLGVGAPPVAVYPNYGLYPGYAPVVRPYPIAPYPYAVARPYGYGPRPYYGPRYGYPYGYGHRRW